MAFDLLKALLETEALRLPPLGEVFWYTSGTLGPYYINTENVYGGPAGAKDLLAFRTGRPMSPFVCASGSKNNMPRMKSIAR